MPRKPKDPEESLNPYDEADDYGPDLLPDMGGVIIDEDIIWDDERRPSTRGKRDMPEDQEPREFPKFLIIAIVALVIVIPAGIMLYDAANNGMPAPKHLSGSPEVYNAAILEAESHGRIAASYHDSALINFSRGQYDLAIGQMTIAADYSLRSMDSYLAAVREMPEDYKYANYSSEGALYMHEAEINYIEAFKSYRAADVENASKYWDVAKHYVGLAEIHEIVRG